MKNKKILLLLTILLMVGGAIIFLPSDEKKIKNHLASLADYCSTVKQEPIMETLKKAALAAKLCTDPCTANIESLKIDNVFSQKEITDRILMMKKRLPGTIFSFQDTAVNILDGGKAQVTTTLRLIGETVDGQFTDAYEIHITSQKTGGDWLFSSFTVFEFMKR